MAIKAIAKSEYENPRNGLVYYDIGSQLTRDFSKINKRLFKQDLDRGVKRLPDYAYMKGAISTTDTLRYFCFLATLYDMRQVISAKMEYKRNKYTFTLYTSTGHTFVFSGASGGYFGTGSRATYDILKFCGFKEEQYQRAFHYENFTCRKKV